MGTEEEKIDEERVKLCTVITVLASLVGIGVIEIIFHVVIPYVER